MKATCYSYAVVTCEGRRMFSDPLAALRYASFMESVGSDSLFYLAYETDGKVELLERMTVNDLRMVSRRRARASSAG